MAMAAGCSDDGDAERGAEGGDGQEPAARPVAKKYATPNDVFDAMHAARVEGQFDTMVACYSPVRLENEAESILHMVCFIAGRDGIPADKVKQVDAFLKTHGLAGGLADVKVPEGGDIKTVVKGLMPKVDDKASLVADHKKRMAADRAARGKSPFPVPTLEKVKINGDRAEGQTSSGGMIVFFDFIDGSWRSSLRR